MEYNMLIKMLVLAGSSFWLPGQIVHASGAPLASMQRRKPIEVLSNFFPPELQRMILDYVPSEWIKQPVLPDASSIWFLPDNTCLIEQKGNISRYRIDTEGNLLYDKTLFTQDCDYRTDNFINNFAFSPNGQFMIGSRAMKCTRIYQLVEDTFQEIQQFGGSMIISHPCFSPDGLKFAYCSAVDGKVHVWHLRDNKFEFMQAVDDLKKEYNNRIDLAFSDDSNELAIVYDSKKIKIFNLVDNTYVHVQTIHDHKQQINSLAFSPDKKYLASASDKEIIIHERKVHNYEQKQILIKPDAGEKRIHSIAFSPCSRYCAASAYGLNYTGPCVLDLWGLQDDGQFTLQKTLLSESYKGLKFSPTGVLIVVGGHVWVNKKKAIEHAPSHGDLAIKTQKKTDALANASVVASVPSSVTGLPKKERHPGVPENPLLSRYFSDRNLQAIILDYLDSFEPAANLPHAIRNTIVGFSPDNNYCVVGGDIGLDTNEPSTVTWNLHGNRGQSVKARLGVTINSLAMCGKNGHVWGGENGKLFGASQTPAKIYRLLHTCASGIINMSASADGRYVAILDKNEIVHILNYAANRNSYDAKQEITFLSKDKEMHFNPQVRTLVVAPDGNYLYVGAVKVLIMLKKLAHKFEPCAVVYTGSLVIAVSPDNRLIISGENNKINVFVRDGDMIHHRYFKHVNGIVKALAFSACGNYLVAAINQKKAPMNYCFSDDEKCHVQIWRITDNNLGIIEPVQKLSTPSGINSVACSANNAYIAAGLVTGLVKLWRNSAAEIKTIVKK